MLTLSPNQWQEVAPYLDQALGLPEDQRQAWLASLEKENPGVAALLKVLLDEHRVLAQEKFLEQHAVPLPASGGMAGQTVGAYTLLSQIGQGGMGTVWLAQRSDGRFERRAAVKFLAVALAGRGGEERFKREGTILGRLTHPHIAELLDAGVSGTGQPYLVLEHVEGEHIDRYCDQHGLGVEARVRLFLDVLAAVAHAHSNLIVHRDIKPSNVLVSNDGQVKLLDFGIAKLLVDDAASALTMLTMEGGAGLTPQFAAPEQVTGGAITTATDVYSLGVLLYLLLTGQHPAGRGLHSPADLVKAIVDTEPVPPSEALSAAKAGSTSIRSGAPPDKLRRQLRGDLDTIVGKALKKSPEERYSSVTAFADDLHNYLRHEPIGARPDTLIYRTAKFVRRNRTAVVLAAIAFLAIVAGLAGTLVQARTARHERDFAYRQLLRTEATNELTNFVLYDAAPAGKPFTASELLGRAEQIVRHQNGASSDRIDLLVSIGRQYSSADDDGKARPLLEEAYALSKGVSDPSIRSKAACALADVISDAGEQERAEALLQESLRALPQKPEYTLDRVYCLLRGREAASHRGDSQVALARAQAAQQLLDQSIFRSDSGDLHIFIDLAEAYRDTGQYREALANFEQASRLMTSLGRDNTENAGVLYNNWAMALYQIGRPLEAEPLFLRAIGIGRADNTEAAVSPMTLLNYGRTLRELGRLPQAQDYAERAYAKAAEAKQNIVLNQSLMERARIYREQGNLSRAETTLGQVELAFRRTLPSGHYGFAGVASERSLIFLARGDRDDALRLAQQAVSIDEAAIKAGGQGAGVLPIFLYRRSAVELELRQTDAAVADAERAVKLLEAGVQPGMYSCNLGRAYLTLGRARHAQGRPDEAAAFRSAAEHLEKTLGPDHSDTRTARQLAGLTQ